MSLETQIVEIIVAIAAVALPALAALAYRKLKGNAKFDYAVKLITSALDALKSYVALHPEIAQDGQAIYAFVKARLLAVLPLTDEEFDYLFESVEAAIAALLGVDVSIFGGVKLKAAVPNVKIFGRKRYLFR